ncbi:MAG: TatD family hydrolase [Chloroflexi bacterium]|nr:TatD family hydrolase [Chloroflexota bacterium]
MNLTDTHCHLDLNKFDTDRDAVIQRAIDTGLTRILIPSLTLDSSRAAVKLAGTHPMLYAAIGVHPNDALTWNDETLAGLRKLAPASKKIAAIGEIGLDYYWNDAPHDLQQKILKEQLALAEELNLPVIIHLREKNDAEHGECASDLMKILEEWAGRPKSGKDAKGVLHSFSGSLETAQRAIGLGFYIGVTGPVTYKNADGKRQIIASLPLDRLLIETDAPFLAPIPHRGKRNEPAFVSHIADKIAEIHSHTPQEVAMITSENAARLFSWGETV